MSNRLASVLYPSIIGDIMIQSHRLVVVFAALAVLTVPLALADPGGGDAADNPSTADTLAPGTYSATITSGDEDWYRLAVPMLTQVTFEVTPNCNTDSDDFDLELYEGDGTTVIDDSSEPACQTDSVTCVAHTNQVLYARVTAPTGDTGGYTISVTQMMALPAPIGSTPPCTL